MATTKDLTGLRVGSLVVVKRDSSLQGRAAWLCECDCGNSVRVRSDKLIQGRTTDCGEHQQVRLCDVPDCPEQHMARGYCQLHYTRFRTHGDPLVVKKRGGPPPPPRYCSVEGCGGKHAALGLCGNCYQRLKMTGTTDYQTERHGHTSRKNGRHPLYFVWSDMKKRCYNPNLKAYKYYGGRGIKVCERWLNSFSNFLEDVGERPPAPEGWDSSHPYWTLDRVDPNGDYEPRNVRWATPRQQARNQVRSP